MANIEMNISQVNADFQAIKNKIKDYTEVADGTHTSEYANKVDKVYEQGKTDEHSKLWDVIQQNGNRQSYAYAFYGSSKVWNSENFYPKYDIKVVGSGENMFYACGSGNDLLGGVVFSLKQRLEECDVVLDTSECTNLKNAFAYNRMFTELPTIDVRKTVTYNEDGSVKANNNSGVFAYAEGVLQTIEKVITNEDVTYSSWFANTKTLKNIIFEGVIANNLAFYAGGDTAAAMLTKDSITNIVSCLSENTTGKTLTIGIKAVKKAFETSEGANDGNTSPEWLALADTKKNWKFDLA